MEEQVFRFLKFVKTEEQTRQSQSEQNVDKGREKPSGCGIL